MGGLEPGVRAPSGWVIGKQKGPLGVIGRRSAKDSNLSGRLGKDALLETDSSSIKVKKEFDASTNQRDCSRRGFRAGIVRLDGGVDTLGWRRAEKLSVRYRDRSPGTRHV